MRTHPLGSFVAALLAAGLLGSRDAGIAQVLAPGTLVLSEAANGTTADAFVGQPIAVDLRGKWVSRILVPSATIRAGLRAPN
jgi:hypothetical protein